MLLLTLGISYRVLTCVCVYEAFLKFFCYIHFTTLDKSHNKHKCNKK